MRAVNFNADDIAAAPDWAAAMPTILSGKLDDKIAEYKTAKANAESALETLAGVRGAQAIIDEAAKAKTDAAQASDLAQAKMAKATEQALVLTVRESALNSAKSAFDAAQIKTEADLQKRKEDADQRDASYTMASKSLKDAQEQLAIDRAALALEKAAFQAKLKALSE